MLQTEASHLESREVCEEYISCIGPVVKPIGDPYNPVAFRTDIERITKRTHIYESEWKRVDEGGGKFPPDAFYRKSAHEYTTTIDLKDVITWNKEVFLYNKFLDETNFVMPQEDILLDIKFIYQINFNHETQNILNNIKSQLKKKKKTHDTGSKIKETPKVPHIQQEYLCIAKKKIIKYLLISILSLVISFIGYSTIINFCFVYEEEIVNITIKKLITYLSLNNNGNERKINFNKNIKCGEMNEFLIEK